MTVSIQPVPRVLQYNEIVRRYLDILRVKINDILGGILPIEVKASDYTVQSCDYSIVIDASLVAVTIKLPSSPSKGKTFNVACSDSTNAATINFNGKNYYSSSANESLIKGENLKVQFTGTIWISA